ncbi:hypothetical protein AB0A74_20170 [Saccharothrix sp. NPDC042600]|uniref:hypothetical protein n=1 Tax=Saccharothrix TaxID=2071 RepID=UPI0033C44163|nr:hypothetical protein GCM10017745_75350 [Saccharothrix mutabilis subsp. capreolus]
MLLIEHEDERPLLPMSGCSRRGSAPLSPGSPINGGVRDPTTFTADRAIDDTAWLIDPRKTDPDPDAADVPAEVDVQTNDELALFEVEP